jgi:hypothetical protein
MVECIRAFHLFAAWNIAARAIRWLYVAGQTRKKDSCETFRETFFSFYAI